MIYITFNSVYLEIEDDLNKHAEQGWTFHSMYYLQNGTWELVFYRPK